MVQENTPVFPDLHQFENLFFRFVPDDGLVTGEDRNLVVLQAPFAIKAGESPGFSQMRRRLQNSRSG